MAFPPAGPPKFSKPNAKQWAGGPPEAGAEEGGEDPKGFPPKPGEEKPNPPLGAGKPALPPGPPKPGAIAPTGTLDPQMGARAHQALSRLVMEGGLPEEVNSLLLSASQKLVELQTGTKPSEAPAPPGEEKPAEPPFEEEPPAEEEEGEGDFPPEGKPNPLDPKAGAAKPAFPPKAGPPRPVAKPPFPPK